MIITEASHFDLNRSKYGKHYFEFVFGPSMRAGKKITCLLSAKQADYLINTERYAEQIYCIFDGSRYVWCGLKENIPYLEKHFGADYVQYWAPSETDSKRKHVPKTIDVEVEEIDELIR